MKNYFVYIMASYFNGTLYIGVTNDLKRRVWEHKNDLVKGFTMKYGVHLLVYYELHQDVEQAILREKQLKKWKRNWKVHLINTQNPHRNDLYESIL